MTAPRVRITGVVDRFPHFLFHFSGEPGRVHHVDEHQLSIQLDNHYPDLDEWDNQIQFETVDGRTVEAQGVEWLDPVDSLVDEYGHWGARQGLQHRASCLLPCSEGPHLGSADEEVLRDDLTADQHEWLVEFCERWDKALGHGCGDVDADAEPIQW